MEVVLAENEPTEAGIAVAHGLMTKLGVRLGNWWTGLCRSVSATCSLRPDQPIESLRSGQVVGHLVAAFEQRRKLVHARPGIGQREIRGCQQVAAGAERLPGKDNLIARASNSHYWIGARRCQGNRFDSLPGAKVAAVLLVNGVIPVLMHAKARESRARFARVIKRLGRRIIGQGGFVQVIFSPALKGIRRAAAVVDDSGPFSVQEVITNGIYRYGVLGGEEARGPVPIERRHVPFHRV